MNKPFLGQRNLYTREKWLSKTLKKIPKGKKILDAGAGELQYKKLCSHLRYTSQDFAQYNGQGDMKGLQTSSWDNSQIDIVSDITSIPVKNSSFDAVMCIEVLEHVPEPSLAIKELARVLKKNGYLILAAPFNSLIHFAPYFFCTGFSPYWYESILTKYGLQIIELKKNGNYFEYIAQEVRRLTYVANTYAKTNLDNRIDNRTIESMLRMLEKVEKLDKSSNDLLYYDTLILAKKIK